MGVKGRFFVTVLDQKYTDTSDDITIRQCLYFSKIAHDEPRIIHLMFIRPDMYCRIIAYKTNWYALRI